MAALSKEYCDVCICSILRGLDEVRAAMGDEFALQDAQLEISIVSQWIRKTFGPRLAYETLQVLADRVAEGH